MGKEKVMEEEVQVEESMREPGLEDDGNDHEDDDSTSVFSDILNYEGADVWGEVLIAVHLIQDRVTNFQAGLSQLKNAM